MQISHMHPTPLTPADWAFSLWGTIFMAQGAAIYLLANRKSEEDNVRALPFGSCRSVCFHLLLLPFPLWSRASLVASSTATLDRLLRRDTHCLRIAAHA